MFDRVSCRSTAARSGAHATAKTMIEDILTIRADARWLLDLLHLSMFFRKDLWHLQPLINLKGDLGPKAPHFLVELTFHIANLWEVLPRHRRNKSERERERKRGREHIYIYMYISKRPVCLLCIFS